MIQTRIRILLILLYMPHWALCFSSMFKNKKCQTRIPQEEVFSLSLTGSTDVLEEEDSVKQGRWLNTGLLLSSFTDGLKPNDDAINFLMQGLVRKLWRDHLGLAEIELKVEESVRASPCCGPTDLDSLVDMENADAALTEQDKNTWQKSLETLITESATKEEEDLELRFLYIPTALYALRSDSNNTPGKQRQR